MMGLLPTEVETISSNNNGLVAVCANCGVGAPDLLSSVLDITASGSQTVVVAKANCGIPQIRGDTVEYTGTPALMHDYTKLAMDAGARIIGGCCGTSCEHLKEMRKAIDSHTPGNRPTLDTIVERIGPMVNKPAHANDGGEVRPRRRRRSA